MNIGIHSTMEQGELTHKIIGCAYKVFNKLGFGFLESVYRKAMVIEINKAGINVEEEESLKVYYDECVVGEFFADLFVEETIVVELKSVQHMVKNHEVQLVNYLKGLKRDIGLLVNFGPNGVEVKRKYRKPVKGDNAFSAARRIGLPHFLPENGEEPKRNLKIL